MNRIYKYNDVLLKSEFFPYYSLEEAELHLTILADAANFTYAQGDRMLTLLKNANPEPYDQVPSIRAFLARLDNSTPCIAIEKHKVDHKFRRRVKTTKKKRAVVEEIETTRSLENGTLVYCI